MIKCVILDDEPTALAILEEYASKVDLLQLEAKFRNPIEALSFCQQRKVDLIFLDINMPNLNGMQFLKSLTKPPLVVFTTAYSEFAAESYEIEAVDYLLKPISFARYARAVGKVLDRIEGHHGATKQTKPEDNTIYIKSGHQLHRLNLSDILFLQKEGHYLVFHVREKKILSRMNMSQAFDIVPSTEFVQVHKSFIVAKRHIEIVEGHQITIANNKIPVGKNFRDSLREMINR